MRTLLGRWLLLCLLPASVQAYTDEGRLPFIGAEGEFPAELVLRFAKNRLGSDGRFEYRVLQLQQHSQPEAFERASISLIRSGLQDDSLKGVRQRFTLIYSENRWRITRVQEDFSCQRGIKGWTRKPCP